MREITLMEAEMVCGANGVPGAIAGAAVAATGYIGTSVGGGTFKTVDFVGTTVTGAITGAIMGPVGISRTIGGTVGGYGAGIIGGGISREMSAA
ncbi:hypothetical protein OXH62_09680 [Pseudomonas chlororaphis]|uniref:hypothetical protein n=1 Tax=Pseudomonas chlororaphis TaxID=587753 RepID=UPI0035D3F64B